MAIKEQLKFFIFFHLIFTNNLNMQLKMKTVPKIGETIQRILLAIESSIFMSI